MKRTLSSLALSCASIATAWAGQGFFFTFTNNSDTPIVVDFDTVKTSPSWHPYNFTGKLLVDPYSTSSRLYTESGPVFMGRDYTSFAIYPVGQTDKADTLFMISNAAEQEFSVCTTANTRETPPSSYGWANRLGSANIHDSCFFSQGQPVTDSRGNAFSGMLAFRPAPGQFSLNIAYEPNGNGESLPRARYYVHSSVEGSDRYYKAFMLSSISGEDPQPELPGTP